MNDESGTHDVRPGPGRAWAALVAACCLSLLPALACPAMAGLMTVAEVVNVRARPDVQAPRAARLMPGQAVLAGESVDGWRPVADLSGRPLGHVFAPLLAPFGMGAPGRPMTVDGVVNVRAGRGTDTARTARLMPGDAVLASEPEGEWCAVADASGRPLGFAYAPLLRPAQPPAFRAVHEPLPGTAPGLPDPGGWQVTVTPSIAQTLAYDDNVFFKDVADMESRTLPGLEVTAENERTTVTATARMDAYRYRDYDEFDRENMVASLAARRDLTSRLGLNLSGRVARDHSFLDALEETGAVVEKTPRRTRDAQVEGEYRLDDRSGLRLWAGAFDATHAVSQNRDNHGESLGAGLSRDLADARLRLLLEGETRRHAYFLGDQRVHSLLAGPQWRPTETLTAKLLAGAQITRSDMSGNGGTQTDVHPALDVSLAWQGERAKLSAGASREQTRGSGGENIERTMLRVQSAWDFTQRLQGIAEASLLRSESEGYKDATKSRSLTLRPSLRYELEDGHLQLSYSYKGNHNVLTGEHLHGNRVELQMVFEFPQVF